MSEVESVARGAGYGIDLTSVKTFWDERDKRDLKMATLEKPEDAWMQSGGKQGRHTEHLGYILTEMQYMQRTYPGQEW